MAQWEGLVEPTGCGTGGLRNGRLGKKVACFMLEPVISLRLSTRLGDRHEPLVKGGESPRVVGRRSGPIQAGCDTEFCSGILRGRPDHRFYPLSQRFIKEYHGRC